MVNKSISQQEEVSPDQHEDHVPAVSPGSELSTATVAGSNQSRVKSMASRLLAKFEENASPPSGTAIRRQVCACACACARCVDKAHDVLLVCVPGPVCDYITVLLFVSMWIAGLYVYPSGVWQIFS